MRNLSKHYPKMFAGLLLGTALGVTGTATAQETTQLRGPQIPVECLDPVTGALVLTRENFYLCEPFVAGLTTQQDAFPGIPEQGQEQGFGQTPGFGDGEGDTDGDDVAGVDTGGDVGGDTGTGGRAGDGTGPGNSAGNSGGGQTGSGGTGGTGGDTDTASVSGETDTTSGDTNTNTNTNTDTDNNTNTGDGGISTGQHDNGFHSRSGLGDGTNPRALSPGQSLGHANDNQDGDNPGHDGKMNPGGMKQGLSPSDTNGTSSQGLGNSEKGGKGPSASANAAAAAAAGNGAENGKGGDK